MLHVSSWYDIFLEGALHAFEGIRTYSNSPLARRAQHMVIGPWAHLLPYTTPSSRGTGEADFGPEAMVDFHLRQLRWFDYWLKDVDTGAMEEPPVSLFVMGENRWKTLADWPPPNAHYVRFYLHSEGSADSLGGNGGLSTTPPGDEPPDVFHYDPNNPVPTRGGNTLIIPLGVYDQRPVEERRDVLVYTSDPLEMPLEVTGPTTVQLWAASTATDTDFTAKLVDVHPDGYARNLQDGIIRARYRDSATIPSLIEPGRVYEYTIDLWATSNVFLAGHRIRVEISSSNFRARYRDSATIPSLIEPGRVYEYTIDLWATSNVFLAGHRIRVEISSSNFPRFDRNLNTGAPFGSDTSVVEAQQTVYHISEHPSHVLLPVIPR